MDKTSNALPDVQNLMDGRNIPIDRVGIRGLTVPLQVQSVKGAQPTVANVCMCVGLPADKRGTHMSRFVSLIADNHAPLSSDMMRETLEKMLTLLEAEEGYIEISCPFFVTKTSPMSKLKSLMNYDVRFLAERVGGKTRVIQEVTRSSHESVPLQPRNQRLRRPQSALSHRCSTGTVRTHFARRADPLCRNVRLVRTLEPSEAQR